MLGRSFLFTRARNATDEPFEPSVTASPVAMPRAFASFRRQLDLRLRPLELQLGHALDGRAGEERLVADEAQPVLPTPCGSGSGYGSTCVGASA